MIYYTTWKVHTESLNAEVKAAEEFLETPYKLFVEGITCQNISGERGVAEPTRSICCTPRLRCVLGCSV